MATWVFTGPQGQEYEVDAPDDASEDEVRLFFEEEMEQRLAAAAPSLSDPSAGGGTLQFGPLDTGIRTPQWLDRTLAGAGKAFVDIGRGVEQIAREAMPGESARERQLQAEIDEARQLDQPLMSTGAGIAGNVAGNVAAFAPTAMIPGVNTYTGAALAGGAMGAAQPVASDESRAINTALGAAGGAGGKALLAGAGRVLNPQTRQAAKDLMRQGVTLTPGQVLGGTVQRAEDALTSLPLVGDAIRSAQRRSLETFNKAALNRVLAPIGAKVDQIGREGLEQAYDLISNRYRQVTSGLTGALDDRFKLEVTALNDLTDALTPATQQQWKQIVKLVVLDKIPRSGKVLGETFKEIDSELGELARGYRRSEAFETRRLGNAVRELQSSWRSMLERGNPAEAMKLRQADTAYRRLLRVEDAAGRAGADEGIFTPAQLKAAAKKLDASRRKREFNTRGRASMQKMAESGKEVLPSKVPDSGTALRSLYSLLGLGGAAYIDPTIAGAMVAGSGLYTPAGTAAMRGLLSSRPMVLRAVGEGARRAAPYGALAGAAATQER